MYDLKKDILSSTYPPTSSQLEWLKQIRAQRRVVSGELEAIARDAVPSLNRLLSRAPLGDLKLPAPVLPAKPKNGAPRA